jgi:hypothetical protein
MIGEEISVMLNTVYVDAEPLSECRSVLEGNHDDLPKRMIAITWTGRQLDKEMGHNAEQNQHGRAGVPHQTPDRIGIKRFNDCYRSAASQHRINRQRAADVE